MIFIKIKIKYIHFHKFLILNGLKNRIEHKDIELYNYANYTVNRFSKYITKIIDDINNAISENNIHNDFMKINLIQFHHNKYLHYIIVKLVYNYKYKLKESDVENKVISKYEPYHFIETNFKYLNSIRVF